MECITPGVTEVGMYLDAKQRAAFSKGANMTLTNAFELRSVKTCYVTDFNTHNKLCKTISKFYRRYYDLISKFQVGLKSVLHQGLSEPEFYGDLVYKLKKIVGSNNFSAQLIKIISHYKKFVLICMGKSIRKQRVNLCMSRSVCAFV